MKSDLGTFRPSTAQWVDTYSSGTGTLTTTFGMTNLGDIPVPGDYDGLGKDELAVYRPSTAQWFISGPNGTGKSTIRASISDLLFGYPRSSPWAVGFEQNQLKLGAAIRSSAGQSLNFERLKGRRTPMVSVE